MRRDYQKEDIPDLPDPGSTIRTEVLVNYHKRVWSLARKPDKNTKTFYATWKYPSIKLWQRLRRYNENYEQEEKGWKHLLLDCSFVSPITMEGEQLSEESYQKIMGFSPGMIPSKLLQKYLITTTLTNGELLRIERECFMLWTVENGSLKDPHPILGDVLWAMNLYEKFGIQFWPDFSELHVKVYQVMRKALEHYSAAQGINQRAQAARRRAQQLTGVGPGGTVGRRS